MQRNYNAILEKSVWDLLQYQKNGTIDQVIKVVFEAILRAEQNGFLNYDEGDHSAKQTDNKRNGYRRSGLIKGLSSHFRIQVPRDRFGLFKPLFLELIKDENEKLNDLAFKLYVKGLSTQEISELIEEVYGKEISKSTVSQITNDFEKDMNGWLKKSLDSEYYAIYIDALRLPIRRDTVAQEAFYIVLGLRKDLRREILGVYLLPEESKDGWSKVIKDIKERGVKNTLLFITDEFKEIETAILESFPSTKIQRCITHKKRNLLLKVRQKDKRAIMDDFDKVLDMNNPAHTLELALNNLREFTNKWGAIYSSINRMFERKEEYFTYLEFPFAMRRMIYTNNWIENLNRMIKRTTKIRASFPSPESALKLVLFKCVDIEEHFMKYPVTSLLFAKDFLDKKINEDLLPMLQTH